MRRAPHALLALALVLTGCAGSPDRAPGSPLSQTDVDQVAAWLHGTFSSEAQSLENESYFHVQLVHVPIWTDRDAGHWLYVEQAIASSIDRPYRQRIYHVALDGDAIRSAIYELPDGGEAYIGAWDDPTRLDPLTPEDLTPIDGCAVYLRPDGTGYTGSTLDDACENTWGDAAYATSIVSLRPDGITSWDRGYDADGEQVWGAVDGPYRFVRLTD